MKLAIVIEGYQNSGKTSTILHFTNQFQNKTLKVMRSGWQNLFVNPTFPSLRINPFIISSSPSESHKPLSHRFANWQPLPDLLILAEQTGGGQQANSMSFLTTNGYSIITFTINNVSGNSLWERFDANSKSAKLNNRAIAIMDSIKSHIITNRII